MFRRTFSQYAAVLSVVKLRRRVAFEVVSATALAGAGWLLGIFLCFDLKL